MKYIGGESYQHLCPICRQSIDNCVTIVEEGPDTDDPEAPMMYASDHNMLCGGRTCVEVEEPILI